MKEEGMAKDRTKERTKERKDERKDEERKKEVQCDLGSKMISNLMYGNSSGTKHSFNFSILAHNIHIIDLRMIFCHPENALLCVVGDPINWALDCYQ